MKHITYAMETVKKHNISDEQIKLVNELLDEVIKEIGDVLGLNNERYLKVRFNASLRTWGTMRGSFRNLPKNYDGVLSGTLTLSRVLFSADRFWLKNVIMHEILHMNPDCNGHIGMWKVYAEIVNEKLGYKISRTTSHKTMGIKHIAESKYYIECCSCHKRQYFMRRDKAIVHPNMYRCKCGGKLKSFDSKTNKEVV